MPVDIDKMKAISPKARRRRPKVHKDQTSFGFLDKNAAIDNYNNVEDASAAAYKNALEKFKGMKVDWAKIAGVEEPVFDYEVSEQARTEYTELLKRNNCDQERKKLSKMLGLEFARLYTKYRRQIQLSEGKPPTYTVHPKERRHARVAGEICFLRKLDPVIFLEYWHENIKHFQGMEVMFVPLPFCASSGNIDTVVKRGKQGGAYKKHDGRGHSFCDVRQLAPNLRIKLERAGFDVSTYTERHLLSVQRMAKNVAKGRNIFVPAELRKMVNWIAEIIYGTDKP